MDNNGNSSKKREDKAIERGETCLSGVIADDPVSNNKTGSEVKNGL